VNGDLRVRRSRCKSENNGGCRDEELFHGGAARKRIAMARSAAAVVRPPARWRRALVPVLVIETGK